MFSTLTCVDAQGDDELDLPHPEMATMPISHPSYRSAARISGCPSAWAALRANEPAPLGEGVSGIVLAGSHHWGEGEFARVLRGPLIPVAQTPLIHYPLEWLRAGGVSRTIVCANSETANVRAELGAGTRLGLAVDYFEDHTPRGPAGCARDAACRSAAHTFVVVEGAMIPSLDLRLLLDIHRRSGAAATIVAETDRRRRTVVRDRPGLPGGIYVFERRVLEGIAERGYQDIKQGLLERLYVAGERVVVHTVQGVSPRVLDAATYASVNNWLITRAMQRPMPELDDYQPCRDGLRHHTARVHPDARLVGPVLIGAGASIEADAVIVGPASIGAHSVVSAGALVSRSVVWDRCRIGERAIVDSSLLADRSIVRPGHRLFAAVEIVRDATHARRPALAAASAVPTARSSIPSDTSDLMQAEGGVRLPAGVASPGTILAPELVDLRRAIR